MDLGMLPRQQTPRTWGKKEGSCGIWGRFGGSCETWRWCRHSVAPEKVMGAPVRPREGVGDFMGLGEGIMQAWKEKTQVYQGS